jgi:cation transport regulator
MIYKTISELPKGVRDVLPEHGQEIYKAAFNNAFVEYADAAKRREGEGQEETAARVAWAAVEKVYEKGGDGRWVVRGG